MNSAAEGKFRATFTRMSMRHELRHARTHASKVQSEVKHTHKVISKRRESAREKKLWKVSRRLLLFLAFL